MVMYVLLVDPGHLRPALLTEWSYTEVDQTAVPPGPEPGHRLGTTQAGRDCSPGDEPAGSRQVDAHQPRRSASGRRRSPAIVGSFAAYFGGWFERISLWVIDLLLVLPAFLIIAVFMRNVNPQPSIWLLIVLADACSAGCSRPASCAA